MRRRELIVLLGKATALSVAPLTVQAQPSTVARIGWISMAAPDDTEALPFFDAFRGGLRDLGYEEGRNLTIEARWARGDPQRGTQLVRELVALGLVAIVSQGAASSG